MDETADHVAITRLQAAYADVVDRRAWAELAELFLADAEVVVDTVTRPPFDLVGPDGVGEFVGGAVERFSFFEFVILNAVVDLAGAVGEDGDEARGRIFMCEIRQEAATGERTTAFGVYHDTYRRVGGRWWFAARRYQSLARTEPTPGAPPAAVFPFPHHLGW